MLVRFPKAMDYGIYRWSRARGTLCGFFLSLENGPSDYKQLERWSLKVGSTVHFSGLDVDGPAGGQVNINQRGYEVSME